MAMKVLQKEFVDCGWLNIDCDIVLHYPIVWSFLHPSEASIRSREMGPCSTSEILEIDGLDHSPGKDVGRALSGNPRCQPPEVGMTKKQRSNQKKQGVEMLENDFVKKFIRLRKIL